MAAEHTPAGTEYFSAHIERVREAMATLDVNDEQAKVEAEIEVSKAHWSELSSAYATAMEGPAPELSSSSSQSESVYFTAVEGPAPESSSSSQSEGASEVEGASVSSLTVAEENVELFRSLQQQYPGGFFLDEDDAGADRVHDLPEYMTLDKGPGFFKVALSSEKPFAEGAQAELFHAHHAVCANHGRRWNDFFVLKVFKEGTSLKDLLRLFPPTMLTDHGMYTRGVFGREADCNMILGARLLKSNGRFAFLMARAWGDLRKLIDARMVHFNNKGPPFRNNVATGIMYEIALGMKGLHKRDIIHRDLKAANVLIMNDDRLHTLDPTSCELLGLRYLVADYECSVGVFGTRFWRAPEILLGLKNKNIFQHPEVFSKQSDVYSFGMTCYEILSGGIPFEKLRANDYDGVIGGNRPTLANETPPWIMDLINRCWHKDPLMRPSFKEIVKILSPSCS